MHFITVSALLRFHAAAVAVVPTELHGDLIASTRHPPHIRQRRLESRGIDSSTAFSIASLLASESHCLLLPACATPSTTPRSRRRSGSRARAPPGVDGDGEPVGTPVGENIGTTSSLPEPAASKGGGCPPGRRRRHEAVRRGRNMPDLERPRPRRAARGRGR